MCCVLYVEDDFLMQAAGEDIMREAGYAVLLAETADQACGLLRARAGEIDILVTDIDLPGGGDGWDVADQARRSCGERLPVIYVTGARGADFAARGVPCGVMIAKPFLWDAVLRTMADMLAPPQVDKDIRLGMA